jgi:hypothetical protein
MSQYVETFKGNEVAITCGPPAPGGGRMCRIHLLYCEGSAGCARAHRGAGGVRGPEGTAPPPMTFLGAVYIAVMVVLGLAVGGLLWLGAGALGWHGEPVALGAGVVGGVVGVLVVSSSAAEEQRPGG